MLLNGLEPKSKNPDVELSGLSGDLRPPPVEGTVVKEPRMRQVRLEVFFSPDCLLWRHPEE